MKIFIRDDDLCYWTDYKIFKQLYEKLDVPVSVSLIPNAINCHGKSFPFGVFDKIETKSVFDNINLCFFLKEQIEKKKIEIMIHGNTHEYKFIDNIVVPEMLWETDNNIEYNIKKNKTELEKYFNININFFISPSDKFRKTLPLILKDNNLNTCGIIRNLNDRPFSIKTFVNFCKRVKARLFYKFPYTGLMKYDGWSEIITYHNIEFIYLKKVLHKLEKWNYDMVIEVHYWDLCNNKDKLDNLLKFIKYAKDNKFQFGLMSELLN